MCRTRRNGCGLTMRMTPPTLQITNGTIEGLKWLALIIMTLDHINKYLLHDSVLPMFAIGRLAMPLFGFVLAFNLARPETLAKGVYPRVIKRLAITAVIASVPFIGLCGLGWGWWPLNILATLLISTSIMFLADKGGKGNIALAILIFVFGGAFVEFWWPGITICLSAWCYCKRPNWLALITWIGSIASLHIINHTSWALAAIPLIFLAPYARLGLPRVGRFFYVYYPAHLTVLWAITRISL